MRILALDLDGTTVNDDGRLTGETRQALKAARKQGWKVCFVTGRRDIDILPILGDVVLTDYILLNNGGKIVRVSDGKVLDNTLVNPKDSLALVKESLKRGWHLRMIRGVNLWVSQMTEKEEHWARELDRWPHVFTSPSEVPWDKAEGFSVWKNGDDVCRFIEENNMHLEAVLSGDNYVDIMEKGVNKWSGIERLSELLGQPLEHTICVGNYDNDIVMIENADIGVAVGSARGRVKDVADYVTRRDHNDSAIAEVVDRFIIKGAKPS